MWKDRDAVLMPDDRYTKFMSQNDEKLGVIRPIEITDIYDDVAHLEPPSFIPQDVTRQFNISRSVYLYSWFDYEMVTLAEQHAYTVVEMGIKVRAEMEKIALPQGGMSRSLDFAVKQGWFVEEDFHYGSPANPKSFRDFYVQSRNKLMHGEPHLSPQFSVMMMEFSLRLLKKLFSPAPFP